MRLERVAPRGWADCIVAATGPSLSEAVAEQCRGHHVIAVNDAYRRLPFAEVLYACDRAWWEAYAGCPDFAGEKWTSHEDRPENSKAGLPAAWGLRIVAGAEREGFSLDPARLHYGNSSGFQAINLAILFGATTIRLVGFDMRTPAAGQARHYAAEIDAERARNGLKNGARYEHFLPAFYAAARRLPPHVRIVNCTPGSALQCFEAGVLEEVAACR